MSDEFDRIENALRVVGEVIEERAGEISTHYDGCWVWHANCLAHYIDDVLTRGASWRSQSSH